jgi:hypothetical protein
MTDWSQAWPAHTRSERAVQLGYLDGYCLALEDFLKATASTVEVYIPSDPGYQRVVEERKRLRKIASKKLEETRAALKRIKELTYINENVSSDLRDRGRSEDQDNPGQEV